jgi:hypothetical protein
MVRLETSIPGLGLDLLGSYGPPPALESRPLILVSGATVADVVETFRHEVAHHWLAAPCLPSLLARTAREQADVFVRARPPGSISKAWSA